MNQYDQLIDIAKELLEVDTKNFTSEFLIFDHFDRISEIKSELENELVVIQEKLQNNPNYQLEYYAERIINYLNMANYFLQDIKGKRKLYKWMGI